MAPFVFPKNSASDDLHFPALRRLISISEKSKKTQSWPGLAWLSRGLGVKSNCFFIPYAFCMQYCKIKMGGAQIDGLILNWGS